MRQPEQKSIRVLVRRRWAVGPVALVVLVALVVGVGITPAAWGEAACDISDLPCANSSSKCHIKFRNRTGVQEKTGCYGNSVAQATELRISAVDGNGKDLGNTLSIQAGATNTLNLEKKKKEGFSWIKVKPKGNKGVDRIDLSCEQVRSLLVEDAGCKVFVDATKPKGGEGEPVVNYVLAMSCNGNDLCIRGD